MSIRYFRQCIKLANWFHLAFDLEESVVVCFKNDATHDNAIDKKRCYVGKLSAAAVKLPGESDDDFPAGGQRHTIEIGIINY